MLAKTVFAATGGVLISLNLLGHGDMQSSLMSPAPRVVTTSHNQNHITPTIVTLWHVTAPAVPIQQD